MARTYLKDRPVTPAPAQQAVKPGRIYLKDRSAPQSTPQPRPDIKQSQNYLNAQANAQKAQQEATRAGSFGNLARETAKGTGRTLLNFGKEILRTPLTVPLKVTQTLTEAITNKPQVYTPQTGVEKFFYGDQPRQSYTQDQKGIERWGQEKGFSKGASVAMGAGGAGAEVLMDLLPAGFGGKALNKLKALKPFQRGSKAQTTGIRQSIGGSIENQALGKTQTAFQPQAGRGIPPQKVSPNDLVNSSYTKNLAQGGKNVNPLIQEAKPFGEFKKIDLKTPTEKPYISPNSGYVGDFATKKTPSGTSYFTADKMKMLDKKLIQAGHSGIDIGKDFKGIYSLENVIDNPALFGKYPQLKNKNVVFADFHTPKKYGMAVDDTIYINSKLYEKDPVKMQSTIVHEIQHMKQDIRGMSKIDDEVVRDAKGAYAKKYKSPREIDARRKQEEFIKSQSQPLQEGKNVKDSILKSIERMKLEKQNFQQKKQSLGESLSFYDSEVDSQYAGFKELYNRFAKGKTREAFESMDVNRIKKSLEGKIAPNVVDNVFYSQTKKDDEMLDSFLTMLEKEKQYKSMRFSPSEKITGNGKMRSFPKTVGQSPETSSELANKVLDSQEAFYDTIRNKPMQEKAQRLIFDNINEAERVARENIGAEGVITGNELVKHYDSIAINAKKTGDLETFNQALDKASDLVKTQAKNLTEAGQTIQAASTINKMSPEGVLHYVNKIAKDAGTELKLSNEKTFDFMRQAEEIQNILDPRQRAFKTFDLIDSIAENVPRGGKDKLLEYLNLPRAIMATADLSAPLRQGIFSAARNPKMFAKNFGSMFKYAFSEKAYRNLKADIVTSPNYSLYQKYKLPLTDVSAGLTGREEQFMSTLADRLPIFGAISKGSNRAYTGFLNKMRVDLFDDFVKTAKLEGITDPKFFEDAATFVGSATGRGKLGRFEDAAKLLNTTFFSPRLMASRVNLINPVYYAKLQPAVRKEALKSLASFVGTGSGVLALAKMNGAEVSTDPRSADFGKIKIGKTRYDIWGGFQQYARLIGQLTTGEKISTITGRQTTLGEGYKSPTRESIFMDFLKSKGAPIVSFMTRASQGELYGEKFNLSAELADRFIPMIVQDAFDLTREYGGKGAMMAIPGAFGVGSQTYGDQIPMMTETETGNVGVGYRSQPGLGETLINKVTGNDVSEVPQEFWKPLAEERLAEQKRQAEVDKAKTIVLASGEPAQVGDTYIYLENGVIKTKKQGKDKRTPLKDEIIRKALEGRKTNPFYQTK